MNLKSKVHLSKSVLTTTLITTVIIIVGLVLLVNPFLQEECSPGMKLGFFIAYIAILAVLLATPLFKPLCLKLDDEALHIVFPFHRATIPLSEIQSVEDYANYKGAIGFRVFGSGGYWGYLGKFYCKGIGRYTAYAADLGNAFYIRLHSGRVYLLSCNDKEEFMKRLTPSRKHSVI